MNFPNQQGQSGQNPFAYSSQHLTVADSPVEVRMNFIRKTYVLFLAGILCALVAGTVCLQVPVVASAAYGILGSPILAFVLLIGLSMGAQAVSRTPGLNYAALFGFTAFIGFLFAPLLALYERSAPGIVSQAAILSTIAFGSLTAYVFVTKKDFSFLGGLLFVGIVMLVLGTFANIVFFKSSGASYYMAWISLFVSSGFVLYRTSLIMNEYDRTDYCGAALQLFISFFNIFMAILRILGGNRR